MIIQGAYMNSSLNRKHKSSVFSTLFSTPDALRELYSAIEGIDIPPDAIININTLSDVLFMGQINDVSFTINDRIVILIEHQSTINFNVPLRILRYVSEVYEKIIDRVKLYQRKLINIPTPEFIVLYNGKAPYPDHDVLRLSNAFKNADDLKASAESSFPLELIVHVYNINHGRNPQILKRSKTLGGYSLFIEKIREYNEKLSLEESVNHAIKYCTESGILNEFLRNHGAEVFSMLYEEPSLEEIIDVRVKEEVEEIVEQTRKKICEERNVIVRNLLAEGSSVEFVRKITGLDTETITDIQASLSIGK